MDDLDGIPRKGHEPDGIRGMWKVIRSLQDSIRVLQRAAPQRSMSLTDGGDLTIKNGGRVVIEDEGEVNVVGNGRGYSSDKLIQVVATLANRMAYNAWIGFSYLVPGLYFTADGESQGPYDPRVVSADGKGVDAYSAVEDLPYGPQVGPNMKSRGSFGAGTWSAGVGATAWDDSINPGGGDGVAGIRGAGSISVTPWDLGILLTNHTDGPDGIPSGAAIWMRGDLEEGMLRIYTRNGVDIEGAFTVNGQPVGGAVTSVAGRTGDVALVKGDVGLGSVDNTTDLAKPVSAATQTALNGKAPASHTHAISQVTNLQTTLDGKAASTHTHAPATTSAAGFMSATDKTKLDGIPAGATKLAQYVATGSKAAYAAADQAITTPIYQAAGSTANLGAPGAGQITIAEAGIYAIAFSLTLFTDANLTTPKAATGRTFIEIADGAGEKHARTTIALEEDSGTCPHPGLRLAAGAILKFNILQNTGGVAHYRARIEITKHP